MRIGFIGLGTMGIPMANNLRKAGHQITIWNRNRSRADRLVKKGATFAMSPRACATGQHLVFTCVSDEKALDAVLDGPEGVLAGLAPGDTLIDSTTAGTRSARSVEERVRAKGAAFLAAPVLGSKGAAEQAQLTVVVGGAADTRDKARSALRAISAHIVELDQPVHAALMKLVLNLVGGSMITGFAEALALGVSGGLDIAKMIETIQTSGFHSPFYLMKGEQIVNQDYEPRFAIGLAEKDQRLVQEAASDQGAKTPISEAVRRLFTEAIESGRGDKDLASVADLMFERVKR
jgi:3-hydroxyisobutyrate dehydrogenase-like beta-hydroxyacid dehydrogenase